MKKIKQILKSKRGNVMIQATGLLILTVMVVALSLTVIPALVAKQQLNTFASELRRTAELSGCIAEETEQKEQDLIEQTGLHPEIEWSTTGKVQQNHEFNLTCRIVKDIGFGNFGSFPVILESRQTGRSEVYWK